MKAARGGTHDFLHCWGRVRQYDSDDIAQEAACQTLNRQPTNHAAYFLAVAKALRHWGYHDGRRWTGTGRKNAGHDTLEVSSRPGMIDEAWSPDPSAQVLARDLLTLADPRLVQAAMGAKWGIPQPFPGFTVRQIKYYRAKWRQALGSDAC